MVTSKLQPGRYNGCEAAVSGKQMDALGITKSEDTGGSAGVVVAIILVLAILAILGGFGTSACVCACMWR